MALRISLLFVSCVLGTAVAVAAQADSPRTQDEPYLPLKKCWEYPVEGVSRTAVSAMNGTVYVAENEGRVRALNARTGSVIWLSELGGRVKTLKAVPGFGVATVTTSAAGKQSLIRLLSTDSGLVAYSLTIEIGDDIHLIAEGPLLIVSDGRGTVIALDVQAGSTKWQLRLPARITAAPAGDENSLVVATDDKKLTIVSKTTGRIIGTIQADRSASALAVRENGMIVIGDDRGNVTNYRDNFGAVWWKFKSGARVSTISETNEGMLIGSYDNFLYMVAKYSGDVKWKRRLDGRIVSAPAVVSGRIVTASSTEENAVVLETESGKPLDSVSFGEGRFLLSQPFVSEGDMTIFTLVDGIAAYAPNGCALK